MPSNKEIMKVGVEMFFDKSTKPIMNLAEKIALGKNYSRIKKAKKHIEGLKKLF